MIIWSSSKGLSRCIYCNKTIIIYLHLVRRFTFFVSVWVHAAVLVKNVTDLMKWVNGCVVNVADIGDMACDESQGSVDIAVVGEGMQTFSI